MRHCLLTGHLQVPGERERATSTIVRHEGDGRVYPIAQVQAQAADRARSCSTTRSSQLVMGGGARRLHLRGGCGVLF